MTIHDDEQRWDRLCDVLAAEAAGKAPAGHPERPEGEEGRALLERMNGGDHELLANWGLAHVQVPAAARMLDVGCGGGANLLRLLALAPAGNVAGLDYSPTSVEMSRETAAEPIAAGRANVLQGDVARIPFDQATFDIVTAFETVYFWPDAPAAFAEVRRVLRPGGTFLICNDANGQTPEANSIANQIPGMHIYTANELCALCTQAGFTHIEIDDEGASGRITVCAR